jgi:outer membrane beta-barrel protein
VLGARGVGALLAIAFLTEAPALAQEAAGEAYAPVAVQNRLHTYTNEFAVFVGVLPMDAFRKGITLSGSYTLHLSDLFAWEVIHGFNSFHVDTSLSEDLAAFDLAPTPFEVLNLMVTSNLVFKPVYWKGAWLNDSLIYGELLLLVGGGYGWFTRSSKPLFDLGLGMRLFLSRVFSIRLDIRHHMFFDDSVFNSPDLHHELWTGLGVSLSI